MCGLPGSSGNRPSLGNLASQGQRKASEPGRYRSHPLPQHQLLFVLLLPFSVQLSLSFFSSSRYPFLDKHNLDLGLPQTTDDARII
ncbi:hypothetical protein QC764_0010030 [Podospora pseudoanserina]|uniref:Uncharacterized protein n=1 Tax=Podospora pseudoanserina TaxID=2609844 RepID=A0ABR0IMY6_9PEZI|nr:hypothetical protein QC764_0010030 [Podospora pseudoanserina]